ncbi:hypothetical protein COT03_00220 [Candidatus Shapirobacteria bacterium CG07_land_8_20_14_0_80_39_18]|uniref:Uncharacterized protein n=1 Tax=Candidatus Shapirobacteria bacterium CG07_land_8_20_14_0_80_39_18 TaxID=1974882 RepID=A0A2M6YS42_9BACT|nr:MAG: hypothetical protein COT03_00220 [Candidatus Shapirobacteria bacterium CG07_land_8_20_14_0_80_39_18]
MLHRESLILCRLHPPSPPAGGVGFRRVEMKPPRPWKGGVSPGSERKKLAFRQEASFLPASSPPTEGRGIRRGEIKNLRDGVL